MLVHSLRIGDRVVRKADGCLMEVVSIRPAGRKRMAAYCASGPAEQRTVSRYFSSQIEKARGPNRMAQTVALWMARTHTAIEEMSN
jgi:hypothetical protein